MANSKRKFLVLIFYFVIVSVSAQHPETMSDEAVCSYINESMGNAVGEACGAGGAPTEPVRWLGIFIDQSRIDLIRKLISSANPSVQFMATIVCETMEKEALISMSAAEKETIVKIKKSTALVSTCDGCTDRRTVALDKLFDCKEEGCPETLGWPDRWAKERVHKYKETKSSDEKIYNYLRDSVANKIGFGCGPKAKQSEAVKQMSTLMFQTKAEVVRDLLYSPNPSVRALSAALCERLEKEKLISMTVQEHTTVEEIKNSTMYTTVCSGCQYKEDITLTALFYSGKGKNKEIRVRTFHWANEQVRWYKKQLSHFYQ